MTQAVDMNESRDFIKGGSDEVHFHDTGDVVMVTLTAFGEATSMIGAVVAVTDEEGTFIREWAYIMEPARRDAADFNEEAFRQGIVEEVMSWDVEHAVVVFKDNDVDVETLFETSDEKSPVLTCTGTFPLRDCFLEPSN